MSNTEAGATARPTRDKERTRAAILDAAERAVAARGAKVSLADVAAEAGVTKSGLLHHFPSRDALVGAVVAHVLDRVWDEVNALVDLSEARPGMFTRAYVRASCGESAYLRDVFGATGLVARLGTEVGPEQVEAASPDEAARWAAAFAADGLPPGRALAVRYAADGVLMALGTPYLPDEDVDAVRAELLALAEL